MPTATTSCPSCGAPASGKFCASCGAGLAGASCGACAAPLSPGAKFCHRCGTPAGASGAAAGGSRGVAAVLPWAVAAIALLALVAMLAGNRFGANRGGQQVAAAAAPAGPGPTGAPANGGAPAGPFAGGAGGAGGRAPDISQLSPEESADRLFDRVMRLEEEGKEDSVQFFAPMAMNIYQMIGRLDADQRFHYGSIALAAGDPEAILVARAQADSILQGSRDHLLGLILLQHAATRQNDAPAVRDARARLLAAERTELARSLDEYIRHRPYIDAALAAAKRSN